MSCAIPDAVPVNNPSSSQQPIVPLCFGMARREKRGLRERRTSRTYRMLECEQRRFYDCVTANNMIE
jgi:hypothetical protein